MNICIIGGAGKLGSVIAEHIAQFYPVRVADRRGGESTPIATRDADVVIVIVDTPSLPSGRYDMCNVAEACAEIDLSNSPLVIISSTVNPGDVEGAIRAALERGGKVAHTDFGLAYAPEFVRQGLIAHDLRYPDIIVCGCETDQEKARLLKFYFEICKQRPIFMSIQSAEIMKIGLNTTLTAKLAKANEIAWLCQLTPGADARDVLRAISADMRIDPLYFSAGPPPGGPCFPRDDASFAAALERVGVPSTVSRAVGIWRTEQIDMMVLELTREHAGAHFGVAGLRFSYTGNVDATASPGLDLAQRLGAWTYDPRLPCSCRSLAELVKRCDVIAIAMPFDGAHELDTMDLGETAVCEWWRLGTDHFWRGNVNSV